MGSTNSSDWTQSASPPALTFDNVIHADNRFVASAIASPTGGTALFSSPDGLVWTRHDIEETLIDLAFGNGVFVALAHYQAPGSIGLRSQVLDSNDRLSWNRRLLAPPDIFLRGIAYGGGHFAAVGWSLGGTNNALPSGPLPMARIGREAGGPENQRP